MIRCYFTLGLNATPELIIKCEPFQVLSLTLYLTHNTYTTTPYIKLIILWAGSSRFEIKVCKRIWKTGTTSPSLEKQGCHHWTLMLSYTEMRFCISGSPISPQAERFLSCFTKHLCYGKNICNQVSIPLLFSEEDTQD